MSENRTRFRLDQRRAPIYEALEQFRQMRVVPFDVPGHKRGRGNPELTAFLGQQCVGVDVNSMKPLDNLCHPVSVIREAEELAADAFGAAHAFLMVGGTTSSVQSMVLTVCKRGDEIILPRNVHRSVLNALVLCGAVPVYVNPEVDKRLGISLGMKREQVANVMLTERDEFIYDEMIVHVPMAVHKEAKDILVIGAGDGGVVRELTRYDRVERIDLVEMDPQVVEACRAYLPGNACRMDDRRVHIYFENALKYIRRCEEEYDLIIVDSSDPFGPSEGLFTREFYGSCFNALKEDGIMVNQQGSPFYTEDASAMQRSHKRIASTFPVSRVYQAHIPTFAAGYWLFGFASKKYHPIDDLDADAWKALNLRTRYYTTRLHVGAFYLPAFLEEMLREVEEPK